MTALLRQVGLNELAIVAFLGLSAHAVLASRGRRRRAAVGVSVA